MATSRGVYVIACIVNQAKDFLVNSMNLLPMSCMVKNLLVVHFLEGPI